MIFSSSSFLLKVFVGFTSINWMLLICFNALLATHSIWKWPQKYHQLRILSSQEGIEYNVAHYGRNETFMSMFRYCITDDFFLNVDARWMVVFTRKVAKLFRFSFSSSIDHLILVPSIQKTLPSGGWVNFMFSFMSIMRRNSWRTVFKV